MSATATGEERKLAAHALLKARREWLIRAAQRALLNHLLKQDTATADNIRDVVAMPDDINCVRRLTSSLTLTAGASMLTSMPFVTASSAVSSGQG